MSNKKVSDKEKIILLEEKVNYLLRLVDELVKKDAKIMDGLSKIMDQNKKNNKKWEEWSITVEDRLGKTMSHSANLGLIFETLFPLTDEQRKIVEDKALEYKNKIKRQKEERN